MLIDFAPKILDHNEKEIPEREGSSAPLTLRFMCFQALIHVFPDEVQPPQMISHEEKVLRGYLAQRIWDAKEPIEVSAEDVTRLKKVVGRYPPFSSFIVYRAIPMIDPGDDIAKKVSGQ